MATDSRSEQAKTTQHVTILCKVALPWIDLQLCRKERVSENTQTGPREIDVWKKHGRIVRIRGTAYPRGTPPEGFPEKPENMLGYAVNRGIPRDFWEEWKSQNAQSDMVRNNLIMAFASDDDCRAAARDNASVLSGLEPIQRDKDGITDKRAPRPMNKSVDPISPDDRRKDAA